MRRISSSSTFPSQIIQKSARGSWSRLKTWQIIAIVAVGLPILIFTGLICIVLPMGGFLALLYNAYELRFTNPVSDVWIDGDTLHLHRKDQVDEVRLANVRSLKLKGYNNPPFCVMELHHPCRWGNTVTWFPDKTTAIGGAKKVVAELQELVAAAQATSSDT